MILSKKSLNRLVEDPTPLALRPGGLSVEVDYASITLHLGGEFLSYRGDSTPFVPPQERPTVRQVGQIVLPPNGKILGCTEEIVHMPTDMVGFVQTKGSLARGFLIVHLCDGQIDPGYRGAITLELVNLGDFYFILEPGMPIAQLFVHQLDESLSGQDGYSGRYQDSHSPTPMRPLRK